MKLLASLDPKDRRMLLLSLGLVLLLIVLLAVFTPHEDPNRDPTPSSFLPGQHGAKAAFLLLEQTGYSVERWQQSLNALAERAGPSTVLILAQPLYYQSSDREALETILHKGGRVLATGLIGGSLLPGNDVTFAREMEFAACEAKPDGFQSIAGSQSPPDPIWIVPQATWKESGPEFHTAYTCAGKPMVVSYPVGPGLAVWWASSTPLENGSITRGANLELLLDSVGDPKARHIYWDESLHSPPGSQWQFVKGPVGGLLLFGSIGLALLVVLSFSRRSGPIRALPRPVRTTPIEFLEALGSLYRSTGANATALQIGWERFRTQAALLTGQRHANLDAAQLSAAIERRYGALAQPMAPDLAAAEDACWDESLKPQRALALVQKLRRHEETLRQAGIRGLSQPLQTAPQSPTGTGSKTPLPPTGS